ncbi:hypothetical protein FR943_12880 [Mycobacterium sp. TNTM28]|uniref:Peptidase M4 n=1 Tax=[Mycobacterium] fortunisiensis TaxID=2600579 RepID=A0ABS6KMC4_9MYCO|nr:M4 family metallopeptidase [[Mycobacterium] fortunisiensis]MBU9764739.1 hypothetical protein [[Mycobacterium] fortunisiensis]
MARHRRHRTHPVVHWLRVGAVAAGVGAALSTGSAIASAAPSETAGARTHADGATATTGADAHPDSRHRRHRDDTRATATDTDAVSRVRNRPVRVRRSAEEGVVASRHTRVSTSEATSPEEHTTKKKPARATTSAPRPTLTAARSETVTRSVPSTPDVEPAAQTTPILQPAVPTVEPVPAVHPVVRSVREPAPAQAVIRRAIRTLESRLGLAPTGIPSPAVPVSDVVASMWVALREAGYQRARTAEPATVIGAAPPSGAGTSLAEMTGRDGVTASVNDDGTLRIVGGTFTDATVEDTDGAARVVNSMAGLIGAPAGFADPDDITVQQVDTAGGYSRTIYRVHHRVDGIDVVGSDVVLVTDSAGNVTGLYNYYDARADAVNTTASRRVDTEIEAAATALAAYTGTSNSPLHGLVVAPLIAAGVVRPELLIDATDDAAGPQLVWKVSIVPPASDITGASTLNPGSTYYISAGGADAGGVTRTTSNAQPLTIGSAAVTTAADVLGNSRDIDITRLSLVIFNLDSLNDVEREISTYQTTYLLFFLGPPQTPGIPVFRGLFGWDASAVSAHANMAAVYDYYNTTLGVTSFDDDGAPIVLSTHYNPHETAADYTGGYKNAFWDSATQQFAFGDTGDFAAALDIVGHEYTHAVLEHQGGVLDYGEPGALNEAYADIMGVLIEGKERDDAGRWLIGEDSSAGAIRSLANPGAIPGYRTDYNSRYTGEEDEGGEHYNSTIFSHAAYRMMTDSRTAEVTDEQWAALYYVSMTVLNDGAKFSDGRDAIVATAHDQGFSGAEIAAIEDAFDYVHIDAGGAAVTSV